jgi:hypothetical protein
MFCGTPITAIFSRKLLTALNWFGYIITVKWIIWRDPSKLKTHLIAIEMKKLGCLNFCGTTAGYHCWEPLTLTNKKKRHVS